jgi:uncharacterized protein YggE
MKRTISVHGSGRVIATPDVADVRVGVTVTRPTVAEARRDAAEVAARVLAAVTAQGVARADVRTETLTVQPDYEYLDRGPRLRGQQVSNRFAVTVRNLEVLAGVIDDALAAGATTLDGVGFRHHDPPALEREARSIAVRDARERAELLATEAGVKLGSVVSIAETGAAPPPRPMAMYRMAAAEAAPTPVEGGSLEIVAGVEVTFSID